MRIEKHDSKRRFSMQMGDVHSDALSSLAAPVRSPSRTHATWTQQQRSNQQQLNRRSVLPQTENIGCMYLAVAEYNIMSPHRILAHLSTASDKIKAACGSLLVGALLKSKGHNFFYLIAAVAE